VLSSTQPSVRLKHAARSPGAGASIELERSIATAAAAGLRTGRADSADHVLGNRDGGGIELDHIKAAHLLCNLRGG
jgi:hypothetical protein